MSKRPTSRADRAAQRRWARARLVMLALAALAAATWRASAAAAPPATPPAPVPPPAAAPAPKPAEAPNPAPAAKPAPVAAGGGHLVTNTWFNTDIKQALTDISTMAGVVVVGDDSVQGTVTLDVKNATLEHALDLVSLGGGYVWAKVSDGVYVVTKADPKSPAFASVAKLKVVPLAHITAKQVQACLPESLLPFVRSDDTGNRVILNAPAQMLDAIAELVAQLDVVSGAPPAVQSTEPPVLRDVELHYLTVGQVQALLPPSLQPAVTGAPDAERALVTGQAKQVDDTVLFVKALDTGTDTIRVVTLKHTLGKDLKALLPETLKAFVSAPDDGNSAVVSAPPRRIEAAVAAVEDIDRQQVAKEVVKVPTVSQTLHLDYLDGAQLATMLPQRYLTTVQVGIPQGGAQTAAGAQTGAGAPGTSQGPTNFASSSQFGAQGMTTTEPPAPQTAGAVRTVLLTGPAETVAEVLAAIKALDKPPVQVMIEALVVDASREDMRQFSVSGQDRHWGANNVTGTITYGSPASALLYQVLWLVSNQKAKIKASPRMIAQDGREANVRLSVNQYFSIVTGPATSPYVELQAIEAAIGLTMTPRVALADRVVTCTLQPEVGDVSGTSSNALPIITQRTASTTVRVADGQVIAIGGLLQELETRTKNKIPLLGDLPLVGPIFRSTTTDISEREITIFVVPHILDETGAFKGPLLFERIDEAGSKTATQVAASTAKPTTDPQRTAQPHW